MGAMVTSDNRCAANGISRREFLKSTGIVGAGLVLAPTLLAQEKPPPSEDLNVALLGCGTQGRVLMEQAAKIKGLRFKAVCDIWPWNQKWSVGYITKVSKQPEPAIYADYQVMLAKEKDLQAVIVATPDWMHAEHSIACMKAGLHVYCEKPISNDIAQARAMVEASRKTQKLLQIGHQRRSNPRYAFCLEKLLGEAQLLGRIRTINAQWNRSITASGPRGYPKRQELDEAVLKKYGYDTMDRFRDWRWYKKFGGGPLLDLGSHQIDIFGWYLGVMPVSVMAQAASDYYKDNGWEFPDQVIAIYEFQTPKDSVLASYQILSTSGCAGYFENFMGTDGWMVVSEDPYKCRAGAEGHLTPETDPETGVTPQHPWEKWRKKGYLVRLSDREAPVKADPKSMEEAIRSVYRVETPDMARFVPNIETEVNVLLPHLENFIDAVRGNAKLSCPGEVGYATLVQIAKVYEALNTGKRVTFKKEDFQI
jgi:predicted dehydrogenase